MCSVLCVCISATHTLNFTWLSFRYAVVLPVRRTYHLMRQRSVTHRQCFSFDKTVIMCNPFSFWFRFTLKEKCFHLVHCVRVCIKSPQQLPRTEQKSKNYVSCAFNNRLTKLLRIHITNAWIFRIVSLSATVCYRLDNKSAGRQSVASNLMKDDEVDDAGSMAAYDEGDTGKCSAMTSMCCQLN